MERKPPDSILSPLLATDQPPALGPGPRPGVLDLPSLEARLDDELPRAGLKGNALALARSLILLWHDHLDASHQLSQLLHSADGSYVHGIMHRREPDYGNAAYWFRKVGDHPAFEPLARRVASRLDEPSSGEWKSRLLPGGKWDPFAFIDACESAERGSGDAKLGGLLRDIQADEFEILLERCREGTVEDS